MAANDDCDYGVDGMADGPSTLQNDGGIPAQARGQEAPEGFKSTLNPWDPGHPDCAPAK